MCNPKWFLVLVAMVTLAAAADQKSNATTPPKKADRGAPSKQKAKRYFAERTDIPRDAFKDPSYKPARILKRVKPTRPSGLHGHYEVIVTFVIEADGSVRDLIVSSPSGVPKLDAAYVETLKKWEFAPAELQGKPVPSVMAQPMVYDI